MWSQVSDVDETVDIVGPAVQKNHRGTIGGAGFRVVDIHQAGINLLQ